MAEFDMNELKIIGEYSMPGIYGAPESIVPKRNYPITPKENMIRMLKGEMPLWVPDQTRDNNAIQPMVIPDAYARAYGGIDWFGIEWEYEELSKAAMVKPGTRRLESITDWAVSDEDAVADIHRTVDTLAMTGRFACRLRDTKPDRAVNLADELYRYSRIKYMEMAEKNNRILQNRNKRNRAAAQILLSCSSPI